MSNHFKFIWVDKIKVIIELNIIQRLCIIYISFSQCIVQMTSFLTSQKNVVELSEEQIYSRASSSDSLTVLAEPALLERALVVELF